MPVHEDSRKTARISSAIAYDDYWDDWDDWYHDNSYYYNRWYYPATTFVIVPISGCSELNHLLCER